MLEIFWQTSSSLHTHTHTSSILASPAAPDDAMPQFPFHILHHGVFLFIFLCRVDSCAFCPCAMRSGWLHPWNTCQLICATATAATFCYFKNALPQRFGQRRWRVWRVSSIESQHVFLLFASAATTATTARTAVALNKYLAGKPQLKRVVATINPCLSDGLKSIAIPVEIKVDKTHQKVM